jgi:Protein of unknown function (DUF4035)
LLAYKKIEPFRELREDYRNASVVQVIANTMGRGKKQKAFTLEEMRLKFGEQEKKKQTWQEQLAILTIYSKLHNSSPDAVEG